MPACFEVSSASHLHDRAARFPDDFRSAESIARLDPDFGSVVDCIVDCRAPCGLVLCGNGLQTGGQKVSANACTARPAPFPTSLRTRKRQSGRAMKRSAFMLRTGRAPSRRPRAKTVAAPRQVPGSAFSRLPTVRMSMIGAPLERLLRCQARFLITVAHPLVYVSWKCSRTDNSADGALPRCRSGETWASCQDSS